jgi:AraC-like DNA-binding protein
VGPFAPTASGRESRPPGECLERHRHAGAYVAVVLSGSYEECGSRGRHRVAGGDVLLHDAFDTHLDRFGRCGAHIVNLVDPLLTAPFAIGRIGDPDAIARAAERDPVLAHAQLREQLRERPCSLQDWPDLLARDLLHDPGCRLDHWAQRHGLAGETVSRGFGKVFGITPAGFRAEARARRAFGLVRQGDTGLAQIAAAAGFADQAHMSRAVRALTGLPPGAWRRSIRFKTAVTGTA